MDSIDKILKRQSIIKAQIAKDIEISKGTYFSPEERKKLAKEGKAMPNGSFPIRDEKDLKDAIKLASMAKNVSAAKAFIVKRSKEMELEKLIPESWGKMDKGTDHDEDGDVDSDDYLTSRDIAIKNSMKKEKVEKAKKMPIGTVSNGRKKVSEGKWVTVGAEDKQKDYLTGKSVPRKVEDQAAAVLKNKKADPKEIDKMMSKVEKRMKTIDRSVGSRKLFDEKYRLEDIHNKLKIKAVQNRGKRHVFKFEKSEDPISKITSKINERINNIAKSFSVDEVEKGKKMPIGTVSNGRKKVGEGKWVPVKDDKKADTKENNDFLDSMYTKMDAEKIKDRASVRIDPAKQSKKELYEAVNKKYKTNFKPGSIDEFEDDSFRVQLDGLDIKEIVSAEKARGGGLLDTF